MTSIRNVFLAAVKTLLRGKTFIQALLAFWISPGTIKTTDDAKRADLFRRTIDDYLREAEHLLIKPVVGDSLISFSRKLKAQFSDGLRSNPACMLPSFNHQLPSGNEIGQFLSLDVGGSTLRVSLVELRGREARGRESSIIVMKSYKITTRVKALEGMAFFDWMATRIIETISGDLKRDHSPDEPLPMGLAWSFPLEQTSLKGGSLQKMGKGFLADVGLLGQDLGNILHSACKRQGLYLELSAIVNDSAAALLSEAYIRPTTRFGLILGTGVNIAVHLPVNAIGLPKYGTRPDSWFRQASHVIVNTELGMFGNGVLPRTRWDAALNEKHPRPDFQPLEQCVSGFYLGEMTRLALIEGIESTGAFGSVVPPSLLDAYSLSAETLSAMEADTSSTLETAMSVFKSRHPTATPPTTSDIALVRTLASYVSRRSAAFVAASVFALWELKTEAEHAYLRSLTEDQEDASDKTQFIATTRAEIELAQTKIAFNGSVIELYPGYLQNCQTYIDELITTAGGATLGSVDLVPAKESSLLGAAVALACVEEGKAL